MSGFVSAASAVVPRHTSRWLALARYKVHATFAFALVALCSVSTGVLAWQAAQESFVLDQDVAVVVHRSHQQPGAVLGAVAQPAVWTGLVNTVATGNILAANGGASDGRTDKAAQASQPISQFGDGYFEFKKDQDSRGVVVGLGESGLSIPRTISLPYALEFYETYVEVRENGVYKADTRYVAGDTFKIEVVGTRILYSKNGVTFHDTDGFAKYTLTAYATFTQIGQSISAALVASEGLTTTPPPPAAVLPTISSFTATPTTVTSGTAVTLAWQTSNATTLTIDQGIGTVTGTTSKTVTPTASTTYTLTATGSAGSVTKSVTVSVSDVVVPPPVEVTTAPVLSAVRAQSVGATSAVIAWTTDQASSSVVDYGTTTRFGSTQAGAGGVTEHAVTVNNLRAGKRYYFRVRSSVGEKEAISARGSFVTGLVSTNPAPTGSFDGINAGTATVFGWAQDNSDLAKPVTVHMYFDKNAGTSGAAPVACVAGDARSDVGNHAFNCPIPSTYIDGTSHQVSVWALDLSDGSKNVQLPGSPQSFVLGTQTPLPPPPPAATLPTISSFTATPTTVTSGTAVTLAWQTSNATTLTIDQGIGTVTGTTSKTVTPTASTTYTLTATGSAGSVTKSVAVTVSSVVTPPPAAATITVNSAQRYQVMNGWEATAQAGALLETTVRTGTSSVNPNFNIYKNTLYDQAVNDLGINRLRVELLSGSENPIDYFGMYLTGALSYTEYKTKRYEIINDNTNSGAIQASGFQFSDLDFSIDTMVLPIKQRLEAKGERLSFNLCYVDFGTSAFEHYNDPNEYAELMLAAFQHMQNKYGFVPDTIEVGLEPDNTPWNGTRLGQAMQATAAKLSAAGFSPKFVVPSTTSMANAPVYFDAIKAVVGDAFIRQYVEELSYHRYAGVSDSALQAIASRAAQYGIKTSQLEFIGATADDLYKDLTLGMNASWQQYTLAYPDVGDDGSVYFPISGSSVSMGRLTKQFRQYFKYVRAGAVRVGASSAQSSLLPLAFQNTNGSMVVVTKAALASSFSIAGLPAGTYAVYYTVNDVTTTLSNVTVSAGQNVTATIPGAGIITVAGISTTQTPPPAAVLPTISSFTATPTTVTSGTAVTLAWQTSNATTLTIDQGIGTVTGTTSKTVTPTASTTYTLTATGSAGSVTKSVTVSVSTPVLVRDGYGDTLSATQFYGWFTSPDDSIANVVYEQIATGQQYTQQATRSIARTDAATWLQQTYGASVSVVQPLGFSVNPSAVISAPGTYRIKSVTLLTSGTSISLSSAASGTFTIATTTPPTTSTGSVAGIAEASGMAGAVYAPPTNGAYAYSPPGGFSPDKSGFLSVGQSYVDPVFGSKITRLSADYPNGGSGIIYGRNGFWNADGTKYIHEYSSGKKIIDAKTGSVVYSGVPGMVSDATFDPVDPDVYYYSEYNGTKLLQLRVSTGTVTTVKDFGTTVGSLGGTGNNIDVSGRYFVLNIGGSLRVYDKVNAVLYAGSTPADFGDGYVAMATDGSGFAVIGGTVKRWHAIDHAAKTVSASGFTFLNQGGDHGTLMTGTDGQTYFVKPSGDDGNIHAYNVRTGANKTLVKMVDSTSLGWCDDTHYSAIARGSLRDWVLVDTEIYSATGGCANADALSAANPTSSWWKYRQEIFMVNVLTGEVRRLAHHRGRNLSNYCATPRINVNWDGTAAMFASNFGALGSSSCGYSDLYRVDLYK